MTTIKINTIRQPDCTIGLLTIENVRWRCLTLELPYIGNMPNASCISAGTYQYKKHISPSLGDVLYLYDVKGREWIYIHAGNYTSQILGCILVGDSLKDINNDYTLDTTNSKATLKQLLSKVDDFGVVEIVRN